MRMSLGRDFSSEGLNFDFGILDIEMTELHDDLEKYVACDYQDLGFGVSPAHSSDSGVDNVEEDLCDVYNDGTNTTSAEDRPLSDSFEEFKKDCLDLGMVLGTEDSQTFWRKAGEEKLKVAIDEDHCYTSNQLSSNFLSSEAENEEEENTFVSSSFKKGSSKHVESSKCHFGSFNKKQQANAEIDADLEPALTDKCSNRNAVMARLNRQRKKRYVNNLESEVNNLRKQNTGLLAENKDLKAKVFKYLEEMEYLRGVIENQSTLSAVIKAVASAPGIQLKGIVPFPKQARDSKEAATDSLNFKANGSNLKGSARDVERIQRNPVTEKGIKHKGGICVHVKEDNVSIEFCHHCNSHADSSMS